jgi:hypothetical protein
MPSLPVGSDTPHSSSANPLPSLSEQDELNNDRFDHRVRRIKARTESVAGRYQNGVYITGRPATGKTHTVINTLKEIGANYQCVNCRVSPGGLFDALKQHPEDVIVLDDVATLFGNKQGLQVLQAALNGTPDDPRKITYTLKGERKEPTFDFSGGIIAISNLPLSRDPVADAVASRVRPLEHEPTDEMIAAFMRSQALKGFSDMTIQECWDVVEFVISHSKQSEYRLDLRHMEQGWQDYRQWMQGKSHGIPWTELIATSMNRTIRDDESLPAPISKKDEMDSQREKVRDALKQFPDDRTKQIEFTALSARTFDRRLREIKQSV